MKISVQNFLEKIKKYAFKYKNGFYITPFLANSPKLTFESIRGLPFVKCNQEENGLTINSPFAKGNAYYFELEEGLWLFFSELDYKANIETKLYYDERHPSDYFVLSYNIITRKESKNFALVNGLSFSNYSWNILKPKTPISVINFKGTRNITMGLYVTSNWAAEKLSRLNGFAGSAFESFFKSPITANIWQEQNHLNNKLYQSISSIVGISNIEKRKEELRAWSRHFLQTLIMGYPIQHDARETVKYDVDLHRKMLLVENKLMENLLAEFPGIDLLANHVKVSPTKLKTDFKTFYGESVYQYYLTKKLNYAMILLKDKRMKIKEISQVLNYENEANFTRAFKTKYNMLPSEVTERKGVPVVY